MSLASPPLTVRLTTPPGKSALALAALLLAPAAGCARGPALSESADRLRTDAGVVLSGSAGQLGGKPHTLADRTDPCADGRARRTLRAELPLQAGPTPGATVDRATALTLDLIGDRGYRLTAPPRGRKRNRTFTMTREAPEVTLTVRLRGGRRPMMTLDGSTPCLPDG
ncbi:hypothetical protein ACFVH6_02470 [Spirillospora sp. NPDC127200]